MENQLANLYNELAQQINEMINVEWDKVYFLGEVEKGELSWSAVFFFVESESRSIYKVSELKTKFSMSRKEYDDYFSDIEDLVLDLYHCFKQNDQELWEQFIFSMDSDGKFNVDFKYDVMTEDDGGQSMRETIWAYTTFNYMPDEGTYSRGLLDKYLDKQNG